MFEDPKYKLEWMAVVFHKQFEKESSLWRILTVVYNVALPTVNICSTVLVYDVQKLFNIVEDIFLELLFSTSDFR